METTTDVAGRPPEAPAQAPLAHVLPVRVLVAVFAALIVLTGLTVAVTWVDLGTGNLVAALAITTVKAALVALFFMHLRYDRPIYGLVFVTGLAFLTLFLVFTLIDAVAYQPDIERLREVSPDAVSCLLPPSSGVWAG